MNIFLKVNRVLLSGIIAASTLCCSKKEEVNTGELVKKSEKAVEKEVVYVATGDGRVVKLNKAGKVTWQYRCGGNVHDVSVLSNGNLLIANSTFIREVTPDKKVVMEYVPKKHGAGGVFSCERLPNGRTVVGENSTARVLELDAKGKIVFELQTTPHAKGGHHRMRMVHKLKNGNYLVCHSGDKLVREYAPDGKIVWEKKAKALAFEAQRLPNGNTLISSLGQITEYDPNGMQTWEFKTTDIPGVTIRNMCGFKVLKNGNMLIGCYSAYRKGKGCGMLEVTHNKKLVWKLSNPKVAHSMMGVDKTTTVIK